MKTEPLPPSNPPAVASGPHRLLIVDDHPVFRHGIQRLLSQILEIETYSEADNAAAALQLAKKIKPTLALIDISMPGVNGIELTKLLRAESPEVQILILSMHDESHYAIQAFQAGARGYLTKQEAMDELVVAVGRIMAGDVYIGPRLSERLIFQTIESAVTDVRQLVRKLSHRELEVFSLFGQRYSTRRVAEKLGLSVKTVETHRSHIKEKLNFRSGEELVKFAIDWTVAAAEPESAGHGVN